MKYVIVFAILADVLVIISGMVMYFNGLHPTWFSYFTGWGLAIYWTIASWVKEGA